MKARKTSFSSQRCLPSHRIHDVAVGPHHVGDVGERQRTLVTLVELGEQVLELLGNEPAARGPAASGALNACLQ